MTSNFSELEKHHFSHVVDSVAEIGGWVVNLDDRSMRWSKRVSKIHEIPHVENVSLSYAVESFLPEYREKVRGLYNAVSSDGKPFSFEAQIEAQNGKLKWVRVHGQRANDERGLPKKVVGIYEDITSRVENLNRIENQQVFLQKVVDNILEGLIVISAQGIIQSVNAAAVKMFGYAEGELVGKNVSMLMGRKDASEHDHHIAKHQKTGKTKIIGTGRELVARKNDGSMLPVFLSVSEVFVNGAVHYLGTLRDLSKEKAHALKLDWVSNHDDLSGLPNMKFLRNYLRQESNQSLTLIAINVNRFKRIYLAYGLEESNSVLKCIADRLSCFCQGAEFVCRDMVDRFWFAIPKHVFVQSSECENKLLALARCLEAPISLGGHNHYVTVSMGVAESSRSFSNTELVSKAEVALHEAKTGNKKYQFFKCNDTRQSDILGAYRVERELREALTNNELIFHLQPKYSREGTLKSAELLVRWQRPDGSILYPDAFIDIAEEAGLISQLGYGALSAAASMLKEIGKYDDSISLAVNISPSQFIAKDFVSAVKSIFEDANVSLSNLIIEVTENLLSSDFGLLKSKTKELHDMGVRISIDDFGTGYSNLQRIQQLTLSEIKIDKSYTWKCLEKQGYNLLNAMVNVGKSMRLEVVAEGVESEQHVQVLKNIGVNTFQGFYYSKPILFTTFLAAIAKRDPVQTTISPDFSREKRIGLFKDSVGLSVLK